MCIGVLAFCLVSFFVQNFAWFHCDMEILFFVREQCVLRFDKEWQWTADFVCTLFIVTCMLAIVLVLNKNGSLH